MVSIKIRDIGFPTFIFVITGIYFLLADLPEAVRVNCSGMVDILMLIAYYLLITIGQSAVLCLAALNRWIFAVVYPVLMLVTGVLAYFFATLSVVISPTIVQLSLENDAGTSSDFLTLPLLLTIALMLLISTAAVWWRFKHVREPEHRLIVAVASVSVLGIFFTQSRLKSMIEVRSPFSVVASVRDYLRLNEEYSSERHAFDSIPVSAPDDSLTVVMVIGETIRADHLALNGYRRNTTPWLSREPNLVSFPGISTEAFHTQMSIPRLLTRADDEDPSAGYTEPSFITLFRRAGFRTSWLANQEPMQSFAYFYSEADTAVNVYAGHSVYMYDRWTDADLIPHFRSIVSSGEPRQLVVCHTIGAHWWYGARYAPEYARFKPELTSRNLSMNSPAQLINSYDNCVVATDAFIHSLIGTLRTRPSIIFYLSDHGESLGEGGAWLHPRCSPGTSTVASIVWWSDSYASMYPEKVQALRDNRSRRSDTGYLFHTILDCASISTPVLDPGRSFAR